MIRKIKRFRHLIDTIGQNGNINNSSGTNFLATPIKPVEEGLLWVWGGALQAWREKRLRWATREHSEREKQNTHLASARNCPCCWVQHFTDCSQPDCLTGKMTSACCKQRTMKTIRTTYTYWDWYWFFLLK